MDNAKIQTEMLKAMCKGKPTFFQSYENNVYMGFNTHVVFFMPKSDCFLDFKDSKEKSYSKILEESNKVKDVFFKGSKEEHGRDSYLILENDIFKVYVNEKYLKYFGKASDLKLKVRNDKLVVIIYSKQDELLGMVATVVRFP